MHLRELIRKEITKRQEYQMLGTYRRGSQGEGIRDTGERVYRNRNEV